MYDLVSGLIALLNNNISQAENLILSSIQKADKNEFSHVVALSWNILYDVATKHLNQDKIKLYKFNTNLAYENWGSNYRI